MTKTIAVVLIAAGFFSAALIHSLSAQAPAGVGLTYASTMAGCTSIATYTECMYGTAAAPGLAISISGGAFAPVSGGGAGGVVSFNGRTGNVMPVASDYPFPPAPVTSVNGKTGAVVLAATTQVQ